MSAADVVVLIAAVVAAGAAVVSVVAASILVGQVRRLERGIEALRGEAVPLVSEARQAVDQASGEMARVGAVLEDTETVTATVESASRLAQRAFANPLVKAMAFRAGAARGLRSMREPSGPRRRSQPRRDRDRALPRGAATSSPRGAPGSGTPPAGGAPNGSTPAGAGRWRR